MDFGGMDTFLASSSSSSLSSSNGAFSEQNRGLKHARSSGDLETNDLEFLKMARTQVKMPMRHEHSNSKDASCQSLFPGGSGTQMLSFSSPGPGPGPGKESASLLSTDFASRYYQHHYSSLEPSYFTNGEGSINYGVMSRIRGPFTRSQWMELEHQALIYKYIVANAPVPTALLIPISISDRRSLGLPSPFSAFTATPLGWGSLHLGLGYTGHADPEPEPEPEPGRCRRTDGKKWRCSRDAVSDQKYCERHINRGRHRSRSRKHVEAQCCSAQVPIPSKRENLFEATDKWTQQSNATQLSIAIPSDFSSSSPSHDNLTLAPLALSHAFNETVPVSWESSVGGPLGEVLNSNYALQDHCGSLNLSTESWDLSPNLNSSPTGVLPKTNFGSVSSSNASSPRQEVGGTCTDLIGTMITKPQSITLL